MKQMSRPQKKLETYTDSSLQLIPVDSTEESAVIAADDYIEDALKQRKKEADKPLYLKRI
jgi:hypothetical protein